MNTPPDPAIGRFIERAWNRSLVRAVAMQIVAGGIVFGLDVALFYVTDTVITVLVHAIVQGVVAAALSLLVGLDRWWSGFQLALPPTLALSLLLPVPAWVYGAVFVVLVLVFWNATGARVPLYLTNRRTWAALSDHLPERDEFAFLDIGCGIGGVHADLSHRRTNAKWVGVESAPVPFALAWLRLKIASSNPIDLRYGDMWRQDLSSFDIVYCFLSPAPMPELFDEACREIRPGSRFISNSFDVPGHPADDVVEVDDRRRTRLHVWHMGKDAP